MDISQGCYCTSISHFNLTDCCFYWSSFPWLIIQVITVSRSDSDYWCLFICLWILEESVTNPAFKRYDDITPPARKRKYETFKLKIKKERYRGKGSFELNHFFSEQRHLVSWKNTVSRDFHWTTSGSSVSTLFRHKYVTWYFATTTHKGFPYLHIQWEVPFILCSRCVSHSSELGGRQWCIASVLGQTVWSLIVLAVRETLRVLL